MLGLPTDSSGEFKGIGEFFLMAAYGYILYRAAVLIGDGSEKLLLLYGPGLIGGLIIPILGAVPDGAIVLVSGLGSDAQCQVSIGVGTLAGSTIMLLTIPWGLSIFLGYRDKDPQTGDAATYPNSTRPKCENKLSLTESVISTYANTTFGAKIMMVTAISYLIVTIPAVIYKGASADKQKSIEHIPALVGIIVCALAFLGYSAYQLIDSHAQTSQEMQQQKLKFHKWKANIGKKFGTTHSATRAVFEKFDRDGNGTIDRQELSDGFQALGLQCSRQQIFSVMESMNVDEDADTLTFEEFSGAIKKWSRALLSGVDVGRGSIALLPPSNKGRGQNVPSVPEDEETGNTSKIDGGGGTSSSESDKGNIQASQGDPLLSGKEKKYRSDASKDDEFDELDENEVDTKQRLLDDMWTEMEEEEDESESELLLELTDRQLLIGALLQLLFGTFLVTIFSDPMVDVISNFAGTIHVDAFYVSFIITPVASNASEIYSALIFAAKKSTEGISLGFSALYGAACMNNTFVLCIFCAIIYFKRLEWTFVVETLVILLTIIVVGCIGLSKTIPAWKAILVMSIFPISLILVAALEDVMDDAIEGC